VSGTATTGELLTRAAQQLREAGVASPDVDARILLAHCLDTEPSRLPRSAVGHHLVARFDGLVADRARRVPLQHLTGRAHFRYLELAVGPGVFVPRPETEVMTGWAVDRLIEWTADGIRPVAVDLGTGSGAVAKALATEVPATSVHAVELSDEALVWARRNLADTGVQVHAADLAVALPELNGTVDLVIANPPYIPLEAFASVAPEARDHDPTVALFSGADGLDAIRQVAATAIRLLRPGGVLAVEHAEAQAASVPELLLRTGSFTRVRDHSDLAGRPRFTTAARSSPGRSS
jgi:release factor glutamine methyltransferase